MCVCVPVVISWSIPSTEIEAFEMGFPWRSRTNPATPLWTCEGHEGSKRMKKHPLLILTPESELSRKQNNSLLLWALGMWKQSFGVYLLYIADQWVAVLVPVLLEWVLRRKLITAQLQSDLKTITAQIVEVLHTWQREKKINIKGWQQTASAIVLGDFVFVSNMHNMAKSMRTPKHPLI